MNQINYCLNDKNPVDVVDFWNLKSISNPKPEKFKLEEQDVSLVVPKKN